ncbi:putative P-loop containing nucleoside triphosphate hydrolase, leucine-rich repeat domain superfamily [Helianthus anomalus]
MKVDSTQRPERTLKQPALTLAPIYISRNLLGSKKSLDEIFVGHDHDLELIRDKLVQDQKKLDVVSIVGMGGIGKTTLASKVFNDPFVVYHFHVHVWVTVSQTYDKRGLMIQILESIRAQLDLKKASAQLDLEKASAELDLEKANAELDLEKASDSKLREMVHKQLMGKRYLIVMDDIWHIETWDNIKLFFPNGDNGSRILLTSRLTEVAKHANSNGFIHHLGYLNKEKSWELLCQKVFHDNEYPEWSIKPGMQIVENCQGLPLAVVVIAGVLSKEAWSKWFWEEIAEKTGSYIVGEQNGCLETLGLSYNHLPLHLRECFLYLGGFPEDYKFEVQRLIWLWMAEGFIKQDGNRSLEDIAKGYLMYLIDINLVIAVDRRKFDGVVKACKVHDLVRELCLRKAKEEHFNILQTERLILSSQFSSFITPPHKPVRMFMNNDIDILEFAHPSTQNLRSILWFSDFRSIAKCFRSFVLLRVLDLQKCRLNDLPKGMELLVHLRYFAIWTTSAVFPSSICNLWCLQTLIYITSNFRVPLPSKISDLVNLRHLWSFNLSGERVFFFLPSIEKPMNLQTISGVVFGDGVENFQNCFPCIKELTCPNYVDDFKSLTYLEKLKLIGFPRRRISTVHDSPKVCVKNRITSRQL